MGRPVQRGLQAEVLASFALVTITGTVVLGALMLRAHQESFDVLQELVARELLAEVRSGLPLEHLGAPELRWWRLPADGDPRAEGHRERLDDESLALAREARQRGRALLVSGRPWQPVRFAAPVRDEVWVAALPSPASGRLLLGLLAGQVLVFSVFGATLLHGRLVRPLQRLECAARALADGDLAARAPADGPRETHALGVAFNDMSEALESRTLALEKAVADLRQRNRELGEARAGLDRAERMAAVGSLASGVAHEVGNPMGAMLAFIDLAKRDEGLGEESRGMLGRALEEGERVRRILRQLLDFSRPPRGSALPVDVASVAEQMVGLVRAQRQHVGIEIALECASDLPAALADRTQVSQILLNLLLNAAHATRDTAAARIEVRVRGAGLRVREGEASGAADGRRLADALECRVHDNGPGVPVELRERVFDPFFTTKEAGEGTGLGLSNALRLAEEQGGRLDLEPTEIGACFVLRLPAVPASDGAVRQERG